MPDRLLASARGAAVASALLLGALLPPAAGAADAPGEFDQEVLFRADELTYDSRNKITRATGNVEATQGDRRAVANSLVWDEATDQVILEGNVVLFEPGGEVVGADRVELTGDLKDGVIDDLRATLADGAMVTASHGTRSEGNISALESASYTACIPCASNPESTPIWQVRSVRVKHNQQDKIVEFSHSWVEFDGIPLAYVPYFYTPDPTVKRKSGLLIPGFGHSSDLGFFVQVPYYAVLSDSSDATITPWFTTEEGPVLQGQYRQALTQGNIQADGSITYDSRQRVRGHIFSENRYDIDDDWRAGLDVQRATGRTYLRRYGFNSSRTLTSRLFGENFSGNNYFVGNALAFQNMQDGTDQSEIPYVAPLLDYYYVGDQDAWGGQTDARLNTAVLTRKDGTDTRRLSARAGWSLPMVGPVGDLFTVSTALWADGYNVDDETSPDRENEYSGFSGRVFPQASAQWRLPLVRDGGSVQQIIEPIGEVVLAPNYGNPSRIPNEDSQDFDLQETNLFGFDRLPGIDLVDEGPRANYGLNWSLFGPAQMSASAFVGQSYSFTSQDDNTFGKGTGLQNSSSDVVTAFNLVPVSWLDLHYRNRVDSQTGELNRNDLGALVGVDAVRLRVSYLTFDGQPQNDLQGRKELSYGLDNKLTREWRTRIYGITDVKSDAQREIGMRLIYEDECFFFSTDLARQNYKDNDLEPSNVVYFRLGLKTLGDVRTGTSLGGG